MVKASSFNPLTCAIGAENKAMILDMKDDVKEIKSGIADLSVKVTDLFNHQSDRWPPGAVWAIGIITAIATAVLTAGVMKYF